MMGSPNSDYAQFQRLAQDHADMVRYRFIEGAIIGAVLGALAGGGLVYWVLT